MPGLLATAVMLLLVVPALERYAAHRYSIGFADGYNLIAQNVAEGHGYRWSPTTAETMTREPGYPLLLAAAFKIAGPTTRAALLLNLLLMAGTLPILMTLARKLTSDRRAPVIAALLLLLYPGTVTSEARGGVEILFIFAGFLFLLAFSWAEDRGGLWRYLLAGLAFGAVVEVRSTPITFPFLLLAYVFVTSKGMRERFNAGIKIAVLVCGMLLVMFPWVMRNYALVHQFVPFPTIQGLASQEGLCICRKVTFGVDDVPVTREAGRQRGELARELGMRFEGAEYAQVFYDAGDEVKFNRILTTTARREFAKNPPLLVRCSAKNLFFNLWFLGKTWSVTKLNMLVQLPMLALVLYGLWVVWRRGELRRMDYLVIYAASIAVTHSLVIAEARYSIPVFAFLTIPASAGVSSIWDALRGHSKVA